MKISNINLGFSQLNYHKKITKQNTLAQNPQEVSQPPKMFAYQDFNISFGGRTPENFYEQDFNRNNMPQSMKEYLFYDYETRQHIPPQQMMAEVFKYISSAQNFEKVKDIYPDEDLFANLHENNQKNITNILAEIKMAGELTSTPLLKDGSDNFGMYLLRKIYLEGKTIKEINKDFYEKDMNDDFKGIITKPIDTGVTSAFGIRFPKHAFWHSFIATREEYKKFFVTLPKNSANPAAHIKETNTKNTNDTNDVDVETKKSVPAKRKYNLQKFRKTQLADDIKNSKGTVEDIEKKIRKRFGSKDSEASFIVKYLSPIMTVAVDRVNLSEELKLFNEMEKLSGKIGDETFMFSRFWKNNPQLRTEFAQAITDTMEMFESIYAAGGSIPINSDLEFVSPDTKNQNIIDYVSLDYLDFLNQIKNLEIERLNRYSEHDNMQTQWENHFIEMYPEENKPEEIPEIVVEEETDSNLSHDELLLKIAKESGADVYTLKGKNGGDVVVTGNLDEAFHDYLVGLSGFLPSSYAKTFVNDLQSADLSKEFKLTSLILPHIEKIDENEPQIMSPKEYSELLLDALCSFYNSNLDQSKAVDIALADTLILAGFNEPKIFAASSLDYMLDYCTKGSNIDTILSKNKSKLNILYEAYKAPMKSNDVNKIALNSLDIIEKYNPENSVAKQDVQAILLMLKEMINNDKTYRSLLRSFMQKSIFNYPYMKAILNKNYPAEFKQQRFEKVITPYLMDLLDTKILAQIINKETVLKYSNKLTPFGFNRFLTMESELTMLEREYYYTPTNQLKSKYIENYKIIKKTDK